MTANPIELIGGLANTNNVPKADVIAWAKSRVSQVLENNDEIRTTNLSGQLVVFVKTSGTNWRLDTLDTTSLDDDVTCVISLDGKRYKPLSAAPAPTPLSLGGVFSHTPVAYRFITGINTDGTLLDRQPDVTDLTGVDTDGTLASNSDDKIASQKAVKTYVAAYIAAQDVEVLKGAIDCSGNPNYPSADAGHVYRVSVAGKIGGASGINVEVGDRLECFVDGTASGNQATVGANWIVSQTNIVNAYYAGGADVAIADGGTGASTAAAAFDALAPTTTRGDVVVRGAASNGRVGIGSAGSHFQSDGTDAGWAAFLNPGTSAVPRTWNAKAADIVHVADFGAVGDGVADDTAKFAAAAAALGAKGGTVLIGADKTYLIDNNLTVPTNVTFKGRHNSFQGFFTEGSRIVVNSAKTITLSHTSGFEGCYFLRKGMTTSENDASAYAGTLLTGIGNDINLRNLMAVGFNKLFVSSGVGRLIADHIQFDCVNGFDITGSLDTPHITRCHGWPFGTVLAASPVTTFGTGHYLFRNGTAYKFTNCVDWAKPTDCFAFGYLRGFDIVDSPNMTLLNCGADGVSNAGPGYVISGTRGFNLSGASKEVTLLGCQAAAQDYGFFINLTSESDSGLIEGCSVWFIKSAGVSIANGSPIIRGNSFRAASAGSGIGVAFASANDEPIIDGNIIDGFGDAINGISNYAKAAIGKNRILNCTNNSTSVGVFQAASASTLPIGPLRDVYEVTGTTTVTALPATYPGHIVDLRFTGAVQFTHNGTSLILPEARNLTTAAGDALRLVNIGGANWRCIGLVEASTSWKAYTPSLSPASGAFTSATVAGKYRLSGRTCHFTVTVIVTTLGTAGGGYILIGLPFTSAGNAICVGRGSAVSGKMTTATIVATATTAPVVNYDNTFPVATGETLILNGTYEI